MDNKNNKEFRIKFTGGLIRHVSSIDPIFEYETKDISGIKKIYEKRWVDITDEVIQQLGEA